MKKYIVMVTIKFGIDDTLHCEYTGIEHDTYKEANKERFKSIYEKDVLSASIYEVER